MASNYWSRQLSRRRVLGGVGLAGIGAGAFALAGCGDDDSKPAATTAPQTGGTTAPTAAAASPTAAPTKVDLTKLSDDDFFKAIPVNPAKDWKDSDIKMGGKMVRAHNRPGHFDWITVVGGGFTIDPSFLTYNRLVRYNCAQGMKTVMVPELEGDLATKWEKPDPTTLLLTLASNVKWQDLAPLNGRPFTIDDIKFTFERGKTYPGSAYKATYSLFESIDAVGTNQVRIKLSRVQPLAEQYLAGYTFPIISPEIGSNPDLAKTKLVGTGPFVMDAYTPNQVIEFKKNPSFFKKDAMGRQLPYLDGVTIQYFADPNGPANAFPGGQLDSSYSEVSFLGATGFDGVRDFNKRLPNAALQMVPTSAPSIALIAQWTHSAWKDVRFRRAMNMLLDRDGIAKQLFKGQAIVNPYFPWPVLFDTAPTTAQMGPYFKYDLKEAKALLDATGLGAASYDIEYVSSPGNLETMMLLMQQAGAQIGLKLNLVKIPDQTTLVPRQLGKQFKDFTIQLRGVDYVDAAATAAAFVTGGGRNVVAGNSDPELDAIYAKLEPATGDTRKQLSKQFWDRMLDQVYEVAGVREHSLHAYHPRLKNYLETIWSARAFGLGQADAIWLDPTAKL